MFKLRSYVVQFLVYAFVLFLVACAGQEATPTDESTAGESDVSPKAMEAAKEAEVAKETVQKEPEAPTIKTIPRQEVEEPTVALEPLAAQEPEKPVEQAPEVIKQETPSAEVVEPKAEAVTEAETSETAEPQAKPVESVSEPVKEPEMVAAPAKAEKTEAPVKTASESVPELPSDPNTFIVTVGPKAVPHPSMGKGHAMGFIINGVSGKQLVLERGKTYTFDVRTNPKHDVYFSRKEIGWGASPIVEGVTGAFTYKGKIIFTPTDATPDKIYYACRNHPNMGALIQIVNPGEKGNIAVQQSAPAATSTQTRTTPQVSVSKSTVTQKLMFAEMMINSQGAKRVTASQNDEAKQLLEKAKAALSEGREKSLVGALPEALAKADESLKLMSEATRLVPSQEALAQQAESYKSLIAEISQYQKSHKDNLERLERAGKVSDDVRYDVAKVSSMLSEAEKHASKDNYVRANAILSEVQKTITVALHKMLDSQTIVYDLNFETAEDEYNYELKRFTSYEELIPVAIEAKKPAPGAVKLMESFVEKARKRRDQAVEKAKAGEYPDAIAMLQQATKTVRRALRMVGVMQ